jgi:5-oxoprolinase (ATP-hydrolysing) subunit A
MSLPVIDINCDLGEGFAQDAALMPYISSANIACGYHAGDAATILQLVQLSKKNGVAIGAHPSYADRENFGRKALQLPAEEIYTLVIEQLSALAGICAKENTRLHHVKPHGALYNQAAADPVIASAIVEAAKDTDKHLIIYGLSGSCLITAAKQAKMRCLSEVFADRGYLPDGSLMPRFLPGAVLTDLQQMSNQVLALVSQQNFLAETICIHGDGPNALSFAQSIARLFAKQSIKMKAPA